MCVASWLVSGLVAYGIGLAFASALPIAADMEFERHRWVMSTFLAGWGVLAAASVVAVTVVMLGAPRGAIRRALPWVVAGSAIAAWLESVLLGWGFGTFGVQGADPDLLGATAFLAIALIAVATVLVAQIVVPRPHVLNVLATALVALPGSAIIALNVQTFADGGAPEKLAVLAPVVATGAYIWVALMFSVKMLVQAEERARSASPT